MDRNIDIEALRKKLRGMPRKEVLKLCAEAGVSASTVQKFRAGLIADPRAAKVLALMAALNTDTQPPAKRQRAAKAPA